MNFTLHQLKILLKLIECQSITKAAEELFLTQPAVSIQLKNFQKQFDIPLTEVVGRQLYITDFGKEVGYSAQRILDEIETINYKTKSFKGKLAGQIKLSIVSTAKYVMPYFLSDFMRSHNGIDLFMDVTNKTRVVESLERNEVDFAMVSVLPNQLNLNRIELMQNKLYLVGGSFIHSQKTRLGDATFSKTSFTFSRKRLCNSCRNGKFPRSKKYSTIQKNRINFQRSPKTSDCRRSGLFDYAAYRYQKRIKK
jgi:DNA-binding transcriptional LysR family regulator